MPAGGKRRPLRILVADDDADDRLLIGEAFARAGVACEVSAVANGVELLEYLRNREPFTREPRPDVLLLDLDMPHKDGREALAEIKAHPDLRTLPVVALTMSESEDDVRRFYALGGSAYIRKPAGFGRLVEIAGALGNYWSAIAELPRTRAAEAGNGSGR